MKFVLLLFTIIFSMNSEFFAQSSYSKLYELGYGNDNLPRSILEANETLYLSSGDICYSTNSSCTTLSSFSKNGELISSNNNELLKGGNESNLELSEDDFVISCQSSQSDKLSLDFLFVEEDLSNSFPRTTFLDSTFQVTNEGILYHQNNYYTYGNGRFIETDSIQGYIIKWDKELQNALDIFFVNDQDLDNYVDDLQIDSQGNLVYTNQGTSSIGNEDISLFTTLDTAGNVLKQFEFRNPKNEEHTNFILTDSDDYVYPASYPEFFLESILCFDAEDFSLKWHTSLPYQVIDDTFRSYDVFSVTRAKNGDILGCGDVFMPVGDLGKYHTAFFFRMDALTGELLWIRYYLSPNDTNPSEGEYYHDSFFSVIKEMENGDLQLAGRVAPEVGSLVNRLWLLRTASNGCLTDNCGEENVISSTDDPKLSEEILVFPNPSLGNFQIISSHSIDKVEVYNMNGSLINTYKGDQNIALSNAVNGIYVFKIYLSEGQIILKKGIKI